MSLGRDSANEERPAPRPGAFGRFYLQELVNSGGMADIWLATDPDGKHFAVRKLHERNVTGFRERRRARRRFKQGCEILSQIHNHDYVIGYIEHGKIDGAPYCLM